MAGLINKIIIYHRGLLNTVSYTESLQTSNLSDKMKPELNKNETKNDPLIFSNTRRYEFVATDKICKSQHDTLFFLSYDKIEKTKQNKIINCKIWYKLCV